MAASRSDQFILATHVPFQNRVRSSMVFTAIAITTEAWTVAFHRERQTYAVAILNSPDAFMPLFANAIATDSLVIADATTGGTVVLTGANITTQAALVTDAHIDAALSGQFNSFFRVPAN